MSSNTNQACPKTCGQLTTAAVFICVGVIQLLAGIILLKSEYVYLLAGIDFIAAVSNIFIGGSLGMSSSVWEKKQNRLTLKNTARRNVLAGFYISVMAVNATTAIIMILGDGNKLLTVTGDISPSVAASFIIEILACSYVVSVCAPIVCIVVALVCLAGTRIQAYENGKNAELISKMKSSDWIYDRSQKAKLSEVLSSPPGLSPISVDNVFVDKKAYTGTKALINKRHFKKNSYRSSLPSISEIDGSLEYLDQKRERILDEIKSGRPMFFADDYLQFPAFKYSPYTNNLQSPPPHTSVPNSDGSSSKESKFIHLRQSDFMANTDPRQLSLKADAINELRSKFSENAENFEGRRKSQSSVPERISDYSDSNMEYNKLSSRNQVERNAFSESSDNTYQSSEGRVSITIRIPRIQKTTNSSVSRGEQKNSDPDLEGKGLPASGTEDCVFESENRRTSMLAEDTKMELESCPIDRKKGFSALHSDFKRDLRLPSTNSIAESPSEESSEASNDKTNAFLSPTDPNFLDTSPSLEKEAPSSTNLLKKLWSINGREDLQKLSGVLMDADSLVGLSDEELMARTNRIRVLRKSVQVRSKSAGMSQSADL